MGRNTKLQLQFDDRFWLDPARRPRGNGEYRLPGSFQTTWDVTRAQAGRGGILNFYSGGSTAVAAGCSARRHSSSCAAASADVASALYDSLVGVQ